MNVRDPFNTVSTSFPTAVSSEVRDTEVAVAICAMTSCLSNSCISLRIALADYSSGHGCVKHIKRQYETPRN